MECKYGCDWFKDMVTHQGENECLQANLTAGLPG